MQGFKGKGAAKIVKERGQGTEDERESKCLMMIVENKVDVNRMQGMDCRAWQRLWKNGNREQKMRGRVTG